MYAIVQSSGRQLKVTPGAIALVDGTVGEPGAQMTLDQVLLVEKDGGEIITGAPFVANAHIVAVVEGEARGPKIRVFKKKRRKGMRRTNGHRAFHTRVLIRDILLDGLEAKDKGPETSPTPGLEPPAATGDSNGS